MDVEAHIPGRNRIASEGTGHLIPSFRIALPFSERRALLLFVDTFLVNVAVLASLWLWAWVGTPLFSFDFVRQRWFWFPILTLAWWFLALIAGLYNIPVAARRVEVIGRITYIILGLSICYLAAYVVLPRGALPRLFFLYFVATAFAGLALWRWTYATLFTLHQLCRRALIVGAGWAGRTLAQALSANGDLAYRAIGFVDDDPDKQGTTITELPVLGGNEDLIDLVRRHRVDEVAVAITNNMRGELLQALMDCRAEKIHVVRMPDLYEQLTERVPVEHVNESWILDAMNGSSTLGYVERLGRRVLDLVFGTVGLFGLGTSYLLVALAIRLDDGGPVFYRQVRSGRGGKPFHVIKFRTMRCDAEGDGCPRWASEDDDRVTRVGRLLRKVRLDELPQVINILKGEMSIVGPRPERPEFIVDLEKRIPFYRARLVVKPGLTGWAQVYYEYGNSVEDQLIKLQYDLYYIRHRSILLDLYIISRTVGVVLRGGGM